MRISDWSSDVCSSDLIGERLLRLAMTQCVTAGEIALNIFRCLMLELLRQPQVTRHEQVGSLHGTLGQPERGNQRETDSNEQQGVESGVRHQGPPRTAERIRRLPRYGSVTSFVSKQARARKVTQPRGDTRCGDWG